MPSLNQHIPDTPPPPARDWELTIGANWINKAGIFILVIGMALALGYSYAHISPAGRVGLSLAQADNCEPGMVYGSSRIGFANGDRCRRAYHRRQALLREK
jgi:hypothetical protein